MSTVSLPSFVSTSHVPADFAEAICAGCNSAILVPVGSSFVPRCTTCQRSDAEAEAQRLLADAKDLRDGKGIYAGLTADERKEQLQGLVLSTVKDDWKPEIKPIDESLRDFVTCLSDSSIDILADLVARRIADRNRKPVAGGAPTLVRVAIADLSDSALIDLVGTTSDPIVLNAASAELAGRLGNLDAHQMPLFAAEPDSEPDAATRFELEGQIELVPASVRVPHDEHPLAGDHFDSNFAA